MPFAIILLVLLAGTCALGSTLAQGQSYDWYAAQYGERAAGLIMALRLDDAFHSGWFLGLTGVLCLNLILCNLIRLPSLRKRMKAFSDPEAAFRAPSAAEAEGTGDPLAVFRALHLREPAKSAEPEGTSRLFSAGNRIGFWGAWICHLGILLLILGFTLGQLTLEQYTVYALPGQTKPLGETGLSVTVREFRTDRAPDGSVLQYTSSLTVADPAAGTEESAETSVNAPANLYGYKFFQNSTGWGADVRVLKNGEELQTEALCAGEFFGVKDKPELVIFFQAFYPDYVQREGMAPASASEELRNPAYLYQVYYQRQLLGMNILMPGEELTIDEYTVTFDNPRNYTLLAVKKDRFILLALLGGLVTLAGLGIAFYLRPRRLTAVRDREGRWLLRGESVRGGVLFREQFDRASEEAGFVPRGTDRQPGKEK